MIGRTTVEEVLGRIGHRGAFAVKLEAKAEDLRLDVSGVGHIGFPISKTKAAALRRVARPARHGLQDRTVLDTTVRDTAEIAKSKVRIDELRWEPAFTMALERIARGLGLGPEAKLRASLHNMLVYAPGQFFVTHQDSEKSDDMIATLVVTLPSAFSGGEIVVEHHEEKLVFRGAGKALGMIAFYADCHHEVRPVKSGHRIVLTYNLMLARDRGAALSVAPEDLDALAAGVRAFFLDAPPPRWSGSGAGLRRPTPTHETPQKAGSTAEAATQDAFAPKRRRWRRTWSRAWRSAHPTASSNGSPSVKDGSSSGGCCGATTIFAQRPNVPFTSRAVRIRARRSMNQPGTSKPRARKAVSAAA